MIKVVYDRIKRKIYLKKWRSLNKDNQSILAYPVDMKKVKVGHNTYGFINVDTYNENHFLEIGSYCSIAPNVMFILDADHNIDTISTFPFKAKLIGDTNEGISKGNIIVADDVWIGYGATILSGVKIGQGSIVGAGAVVTKDVEPYSVVGGVPAKLIRKRFSQEIVDELLKIDFNKLNDRDILENIDRLYEKIENTNQLKWIVDKCKKEE